MLTAVPVLAGHCRDGASVNRGLGLDYRHLLHGLPPHVSAAAQTLLRAGLLAEPTGLTYELYPAFGRSGRSSARDVPQFLGPEEFGRRSGYVYPRIQADC